VEDNEINRLVAQQLLEALGLAVVCAADGHAALRLAQEQAFDLILMDIQMPQLDGIETTRRLRERGTPLPPVVALTAHAMIGDRERFLDAGMDDYLTKPIEEDALLAVLARWLPQAPPETPAHAAQPAAAPALPALAGIDLHQALQRVNGKADLLWRLIGDFRQRYGDAAAQAAAQLDAGHPHAARDLAHTVKGAAGTLAMPRVAAAAGALEQACSRGDDAGAALAALRDALAELLRDPLPALPAAPAPAATDADLAAALAALRDDLDNNRLAAAAQFAALAERLRNSAAQPALERLGAAIALLDYPAALLAHDALARQLAQDLSP
jgi:CheY-like chemotaxis protein/HPt (histidine-containing phosphotransfer) domain-containing protein